MRWDNSGRKTDKHQAAGGRLRRLVPAARLPTRSALRQLSDPDVRLIERCVSQRSECLYDPSFRSAAYRELTSASVQATADGNGHAGGTLSRAVERTLFLRFNYCRHRAMRILRAHRRQRLTLGAARELVGWQRAADRLRDRLVGKNVALVKAMAWRFGRRNVDLSELESEGNLVLLRCVDKFDAARGYRFSTYACRAILASYTRLAARRARERRRTPVSYAPALDPSDHLERRREQIESDVVDELRDIISDNTAGLTEAEQRVISARFALKTGNDGERSRRGWTLQRTGALLGLSKERVRQIQCTALDKLRAVLNARLAPTG